MTEAHPTARRERSKGLFRLFGIHIRVHPSWLLFALFIAWALATGSLPLAFEGLPQRAYWGMALLVVVGLAVSIVLHEMGHSLVARALGLPIERITLFALGGVAELTEEPKAARTELAMAIAGPIVSGVLAGLFALLAARLQEAGVARELVGALAYLGTLNLVLAIFNMVPAFPLDGGRVLRALIWMGTKDLRRATEIATRVGEFFGLFLILGGVLLAVRGDVGVGLWWILIGAFLRWSATSSRRDMAATSILAGVPVAELMAGDLECAPADMPLDEFVAEKLLRSRHGFYPVVQDDRWLGVVGPEQVSAVPRAAWPSTAVGSICRPAAETVTSSPRESLSDALGKMRRSGAAYLPVVDRGDLVGVISLRDVMGRLSLEQLLGPQAALQPR